jgi:ADP-glucose pyrophosphorylase
LKGHGVGWSKAAAKEMAAEEAFRAMGWSVCPISQFHVLSVDDTHLVDFFVSRQNNRPDWLFSLLLFIFTKGFMFHRVYFSFIRFLVSRFL